MQRKRIRGRALVLCCCAALSGGQRAARAAPADSSPAPTAADEERAQPSSGYDAGFFLRGKDNRYSVTVNGFAQVLYSMAAQAQSATHNFDLALGRLSFAGNVLDPRLSYLFQVEGSTFGNNNVISMLDWWMKYRFSPHLSARFGRGLVPYSRQFSNHPGQLLFADISPAELSFGLFRSIGIELDGAAGPLSYYLFAGNSVRGLDSATQANLGDSLAVGSRVDVAILNPYGYQETVPEMPEDAQLSIGAAVAFNPVADSSRFQNSQPGDRTLNATVDVGFRKQRCNLQSAFYFRRTFSAGAVNNFGYYGQAGVYLIRSRLEVAARVSQVIFANRANLSSPDDVNSASLPSLDVNSASGNVSEYSGGLNVYLFGHGAKLQSDYTLVDSEPFAGPVGSIHRVRVQVQVLF